jgi:formamidopyrimidine-DNA glycosylase
LYRAGIDPARKAADLKKSEVQSLVPLIRDVLSEAIEAGGSSLQDYRQADGELGYFQHSFRVYGREGEACSDTSCDEQITRISQSGRSTFFCRSCQS